MKEGLGVEAVGRDAKVPKLERQVFGKRGWSLTLMGETKRVTAVAPRSGLDFGAVLMSRESDQLREPGLLA